MYFLSAEESGIFDPEVDADAVQRLRVLVISHVSQQREVLDETTGLSLWRVSGTNHAPLRGLQRARTRHLARLKEFIKETIEKCISMLAFVLPSHSGFERESSCQGRRYSSDERAPV